MNNLKITKTTFLALLLVTFSALSSLAKSVDEIQVFKDQRRMNLLLDGEIVKSYDIKLSFKYNNPFFSAGPKRLRGDNQTPEGDYIIKRKVNEDWSNFKKSLLINYPNEKDIAWGKENGYSVKQLGDAILIHGYPKKVDATAKKFFKYVLPWTIDTDEEIMDFFVTNVYPNFDWTNGCIAVSDSEMDEIYELVDANTKITINP